MSPSLLLERAINVDRPRQAIVDDITYLPLQNGQWAYLATWMDLFSRKIVGWQIADSMTADLVIEGRAGWRSSRARYWLSATTHYRLPATAM